MVDFKYKASVIVPVYNAKEYLSRCLNSLVRQTYKNLEIILIDDGSTDGSSDICDEYAAKDQRFRVFHVDNAGVSAARNLGLIYATGLYVSFVDSDDLVSPNYMERLIDVALETKCDVVTCCSLDLLNENVMESWPNMPGKTEIISIGDGFDYTKQTAHTTIWGGVFSRNVLHGIYFAQDLIVGEDTLFFAQVINKVRTVAYVDEPLYCYVVYACSASKGEINEAKLTEIVAWERVCELFKNENKKFVFSCKTRYAITCKNLLHRMIQQGSINSEWFEHCAKGVRRNLYAITFSSLNKKSKIAIIICGLFPRMYTRIAYYKRK